MGSYAECWLGSFYIGETKNDVHPVLMALFRAGDKNIVHGKKQELPFQLRHWLENLEEDEEVSAVFYRAPLSIVRDRLELMGYTLETAKSAFTISARAEAVEVSERMKSVNSAVREVREFQEATVRVLAAFDVDKWLAALQFIRAEKLTRHHRGGDTKPYYGTLIEYMLDHDWYGYPGLDLNVALRLALEICSDGDEFIYDVTDLILSGDYSSDEDFASYALDASSDDYSSYSKTIVVTEGRSDSWIIAESLKLLCPHLADYFTFMDFEGARVSGGAGSLANIVKAFAGAGIINRVVAIFDNDTAGEVAIRSLRNINVPANIQILKLPELSILRKYPTIGPTGSSAMNVNGIAASIELYLGTDVLSDEQGELAPVQWTGYESSLGKYQGEVLSKDKIHERFKRRLGACTADPSMVGQTDWAGVRAILSAIFAAFHELDRNLINQSTSEYPLRDI
jgi:hypothetical protein